MAKMRLGDNDKFVVERLRSKQLGKYVKPFLEMVEWNKLKKIDIRPMTWKSIMKVFRDVDSDRYDLEVCISSYLVHFGLIVVSVENKKKKVPNRITRERVKKHRVKKKALGYKTITVELTPADYDRLKDFKKDNDFTYANALNYLIGKLPPRVDKEFKLINGVPQRINK